ncbi:MAG: thioredoxin family protein [Thermoplasmata archaeon]|nr:thioredoxin family protein [Thermoplasmata archaeon]
MAELSTFALHTGDLAPGFDLPGVDGKHHSLSEFAGSKLLVVTFWCNHCPYVQAWEGRTIELARRYATRSVQFVLISSNDVRSYPSDGFPAMVERARDKGYPFPYLWDESQAVARSYGALVTPHPMLFDRERRLVFQGRIDDNHEHPEAVRHQYLAQAIDRALAGKPMEKSELPVLGCSVKWRS